MPQKPVPVILSLGSNRGARREYLRAAVERLKAALEVVRFSSVYETSPIDAPAGSSTFLNLVLAASTRLTAFELLRATQEIEYALGRRRRLRNEPRVIDIDLILYGSTVLRSRELTLPHPRFRERRFVTEPLKELRLDWVDPETGKRLHQFGGEGEVRRAGRLY